MLYVCADMAELADALDLGSSGFPVQVQVLLSAPDSKAPRTVRFEGLFNISKKKDFHLFYAETRTEFHLVSTEILEWHFSRIDLSSA